MPVIPNDIAIIVAILITAISHRLRDDRLSQSANGIIALVALVSIAIAVGWLVLGFSLDFKQDILLIIGIFVSLYSALPEFKALLQILSETPSPLAPPPDPLALRATAQDWRNRPGGPGGA